jgi:hypothetical protein
MPNQVDDALPHAMDDSELSRVPTEFNQLLNIANRRATSSTTEARVFWPGHFGNFLGAVPR